MSASELRKTISKAIIERVILLDMPVARAKTEAKAYFLGAEQALKVRGDEVGAMSMHEAYSLVVEAGFKPIVKWAESANPFSRDELREDNREAA